MGTREELIQRSVAFLREVKDMTPGAKMEKWLNEKYGEQSELYKDLSRLIKLGVAEGWAANEEVAGPNYRRSRILEPSPETFHFSITAVYMNSNDPHRFNDAEENGVCGGSITATPMANSIWWFRWTRRRVEGLAGMARAGLDSARSRKPSLSGGQRRRAHSVILSSRWQDFVRF